MSDHHYILAKIDRIIKSDENNWEVRLKDICQVLRDSIPYFNWVGFYFANHQTKMLHLKAFAGIPTDHTEIPFGKGICGQVALSNKNFVVPNVQDQDNYIACDINVKSELVVPLFVDGINVGQIDIDSNALDPFDKNDTLLLEKVNQKVAHYIPNIFYTLA